MLGVVYIEVDCPYKEQCARDKGLCRERVRLTIDSLTGDWNGQQPFCDEFSTRTAAQELLDTISKIQLLASPKDRIAKLKKELEQTRAKLAQIKS